MDLQHRQANPPVTTTLDDRVALGQLRLLIEAAALAPSLHNTQPWTFRVDRNVIDVYVDVDRDVPLADPDHRQQTIGCSAAVFNMRVAAAYGGFGLDVQVRPDPDGRPDLAARVRFDEPDNTPRPLDWLYPAIRMRRTNRYPYDDRTVDPSLRDTLSAAAATDGAQLSWLTNAYMQRWAQLLDDEAEQDDVYDPARRAERAAWVGGQRRVDGVPTTALGPRAAGPHRPTRDLAAALPDLTRRHASFEQGAAIAVLSTLDDDPPAWWHAGQALERTWLTAANLGLSISFRNSALEYRSRRWLLRDPLAGRGYPQMVLRVGYGPTVAPTPRRSPTDLVAPARDQDPTTHT